VVKKKTEAQGVKKTEAQGVLKPSLPTRFALSSISDSDLNKMHKTVKKPSRARMSKQLSTEDVRMDIKIITCEDVHSNMLHSMRMQWLRKDAALMLSALTHEAQNYCFSMKCTFSSLECALGQLAKGLRRDFLDTNAQYWHRNAMGSCACANLMKVPRSRAVCCMTKF
jgi:hypothetical protein